MHALLWLYYTSEHKNIVLYQNKKTKTMSRSFLIFIIENMGRHSISTILQMFWVDCPKRLFSVSLQNTMVHFKPSHFVFWHPKRWTMPISWSTSLRRELLLKKTFLYFYLRRQTLRAVYQCIRLIWTSFLWSYFLRAFQQQKRNYKNQ